MEVAPGQAEEGGKVDTDNSLMLPKLEQISGMACISLFSLAAIPSPTAEKRKEKGNPGQKERERLLLLADWLSVSCFHHKRREDG